MKFLFVATPLKATGVYSNFYFKLLFSFREISFRKSYVLNETVSYWGS